MDITLLSTHIAWEDKPANFRRVSSLVERLPQREGLLLLPEMFATGFTMDTALAEDGNGESVRWLQESAARWGMAIYTSIPFRDFLPDGRPAVFNRGLFVYPSGKTVHYDKRHTFRMGKEPEHYHRGSGRTVAEYGGLRFALNICYDIRFPVWSRNVGLEYDVLLNVADFPASRQQVLEPLCRARAIENMAYVFLANRDGKDPMTEYAPGSLACDFKGRLVGEEHVLADADGNLTQVVCAKADPAALEAFRKKFPAWKDSDEFRISDI